jgi:hypothetical protein
MYKEKPDETSGRSGQINHQNRKFWSFPTLTDKTQKSAEIEHFSSIISVLHTHTHGTLLSPTGTIHSS